MQTVTEAAAADDEGEDLLPERFSGDYLNGVLSVVGSGLASQARRIVINNQNPFKIAHAIWLRPDRSWRGPTEEEQQEDMHEVDADAQAPTASTPCQVRGQWVAGG